MNVKLARRSFLKNRVKMFISECILEIDHFDEMFDEENYSETSKKLTFENPSH